MAELNAKQRAFVQEYAVDKNATQAAIRAGYSEETAYSQGQRLLKNVEIQKELGKLQEQHAERCAVTIESLTDELNDAIRMSYAQEDPNALRQAIMAKAKIHGLDVNVNKNENSGNLNIEIVRFSDANT